LGGGINQHSSFAEIEAETWALQALAGGLARRERSRIQIRHLEAASERLTRMQRLDAALSERFIAMTAEAGALRQAVGGRRVRLFLQVEAESYQAAAVGARDELSDTPSDADDALVARTLVSIRSPIKADPRIQAAFAGHGLALDRLLRFHEWHLLPYLQALHRKRHHPRQFREWQEIATASLWRR
jgi:hypothetical protein